MTCRASTYCIASLARMGIADDDIRVLRSASAALHRWAERECNGEVWVEDDGTAYTGSGSRPEKCANLEARALKRVVKVLAKYPDLHAYHQGDPRGCALYVYRPADLKEHSIESCYPSIGVAVV